MKEHFNPLKMTSCDLLYGHNLFFPSFLDYVLVLKREMMNFKIFGTELQMLQ